MNSLIYELFDLKITFHVQKSVSKKFLMRKFYTYNLENTFLHPNNENFNVNDYKKYFLKEILFLEPRNDFKSIYIPKVQLLTTKVHVLEKWNVRLFKAFRMFHNCFSPAYGYLLLYEI